MTLQLVPRDEIVNALPGDPEHRARHRVRHRLRRRVPGPPECHLAQRRAPPLGGRLERCVAGVEAGDHPDDHQHGGLLVGPEHHRRPDPGAPRDDRPRGLHRLVAVEQDLQGIEQPDIDEANQLIDELRTDGLPPLTTSLTLSVKYLADGVKDLSTDHVKKILKQVGGWSAPGSRTPRPPRREPGPAETGPGHGEGWAW